MSDRQAYRAVSLALAWLAVLLVASVVVPLPSGSASSFCTFQTGSAAPPVCTRRTKPDWTIIERGTVGPAAVFGLTLASLTAAALTVVGRLRRQRWASVAARAIATVLTAAGVVGALLVLLPGLILPVPALIFRASQRA